MTRDLGPEFLRIEFMPASSATLDTGAVHPSMPFLPADSAATGLPVVMTVSGNLASTATAMLPVMPLVANQIATLAKTTLPTVPEDAEPFHTASRMNSRLHTTGEHNPLGDTASRRSDSVHRCDW